MSGKYEDYDNHDKEAYKEFCKAVENIKRKQVESEFQGKGNNTKKKKNEENPLLMDFDFDSKMKEFMKKSTNNDMFKPLVQTVNQVSNIDNMVDNLKQNVVSNVSNNIVDVVKNEVNENINSIMNDNNKPPIPSRDTDPT